ncbi:MAG: ATP-dependent sacrificial sulfur transferase LarE [Candidatus Methanospirareceae archaeon]
MLDHTVRKKLEALRRKIGGEEKLLVAFSGGVDSGLLLKIASDVLGKENVLAVTAESELFPRRELEEVKDFVTHAGIIHRIVQFPWQNNDDFVKNSHDRCYHCKREFVKRLKGIAAEEGIATVAEGVTVSDFGEYRPGLAAAEEEGVWHPFVEVGITKYDVREIAREMELPFWDKPSSPCLATRVEYGERLTKEKLKMIESAEDFLKDLGFKQLRVRLHRGGLTRIEIGNEELGGFCDPGVLKAVARELKSLGFTYITLDLEGYRSGSMDFEG